MKNKKKPSKIFFEELKRILYNFSQDYLEFFDHEPILAIVLPVIILFSLASLLKF
ncbi:hypothetical protein WECO103172_05615 [Weissella confusa]|nr:hypothetical protein WCO01_05840 [Weissella confusa]